MADRNERPDYIGYSIVGVGIGFITDGVISKYQRAIAEVSNSSDYPLYVDTVREFASGSLVIGGAALLAGGIDRLMKRYKSD